MPGIMAIQNLVRRRGTQRHTRSQARLGGAGGVVTSGDRVQAEDGPQDRTWARIWGGLLVGGALWLVASLLTDTRFAVQHVSVEGLTQLPVGALYAEASPMGHNIFLLPVDAMARRIESQFGFVRRAQLLPRLPDRVHVAIEEEPIVFVWQSGERYWWVGAGGRVMGETPEAAGLVVVRDAAGIAPHLGAYVPHVPVDLVKNLQEVLPGQRAYEYVPDVGLVMYVSAKRWPVYLGHEGDARRKAAILTCLVEDLVAKGQNVEYIDLRNERRPSYRPG
jgi:cell division septal protein FtsQ